MPRTPALILEEEVQRERAPVSVNKPSTFMSVVTDRPKMGWAGPWSLAQDPLSLLAIPFSIHFAAGVSAGPSRNLPEDP